MSDLGRRGLQDRREQTQRCELAGCSPPLHQKPRAQAQGGCRYLAAPTDPPWLVLAVGSAPTRAASPFVLPVHHPPVHTGPLVLHSLVTEVSPTQVGSWAFRTLPRQPRMFQTVPDTSSYVKVRLDSAFEQVMTDMHLTTVPRGQDPVPLSREKAVALEPGRSDQRRVAPTLRPPLLAASVWENAGGLAQGRPCREAETPAGPVGVRSARAHGRFPALEPA